MAMWDLPNCGHGFVGSTATPELATQARKHPAIILFGDSFTQYSFNPGGWGARLADRYQRRADVLNRGYAGYTSRWALRLLPEVFMESDTHVVLVVICFGGNDASLKEENPRHHVPLDEFHENMKQIVRYVRSTCRNAEVLLMSNQGVIEEKWIKFLQKRQGDNFNGKSDRLDAVASQYAAAMGDVALDVGCGFLDLYKAMKPELNRAEMFSDGLHLNQAGNAFVGAAVLQHLQEKFPEIAVTCCPVTGSAANIRSRCKLTQHGAWHDMVEMSGAGVLPDRAPAIPLDTSLSLTLSPLLCPVLENCRQMSGAMHCWVATAAFATGVFCALAFRSAAAERGWCLWRLRWSFG